MSDDIQKIIECLESMCAALDNIHDAIRDIKGVEDYDVNGVFWKSMRFSENKLNESWESIQDLENARSKSPS